MNSQFEIIMVRGDQLLAAAIAGAKRGYNRSSDDPQVYKDLFQRSFDEMLKDVCSRAERKRVLKNTKGSYALAYLPVGLALFHEHKAMQPCERHARVFAYPNMASVFDIPLEYWERFCAQQSSLYNDAA
jgi:hypothetical protein